ncbi:MAG TPA: hypothetical protein VGZ25_12330 [Gemmataceae bacterium]|nr:hypothetical protein [Gemmataceae bacterium]
MFANPNRLFAFAGIACLCLSLITFLRPAPCDETKNEYFTGKVVSLAKILEKEGGRLDADASPHWLALVTEEGKAYPIIKDDGSRMFFLDSALLDRPMRLTGRLLPKCNLLQVVNVHSIKDGTMHEVYYFCDVCSIRRSEKKKCECCGGPMELREVPLKK